MRKILFTIFILLMAGMAHATITYFSGVRGTEYTAVSKFTVDAPTDDVNDITQTVMAIYGYAERITIDQTGTDTVFEVTLKDENAITIFTKTDCNSEDGDYTYAIYEDGTDGTGFKGVPVSGAMVLYIVDANGLSDLSVVVYYKEELR